MGSSDNTIGISSTLPQGYCFANRYRIVEELGTGGMGTVYRVHDLKLDEDVAVKVIRPGMATDPGVIHRFSRELKLARKISHRHVVRMYELMEDRGVRFIVMEYVAGETLRSALRHSGPFPAARAVEIARHICDGLAAAHRLGVIHRDLKPGNIMIDREGNAHIMDFGLARSLAGAETTVPGMILGTPGYMAPEQAAGLDSDHRTDIFAVGVILCEMLTGEPPFSAGWHALMARAGGETTAPESAAGSQIPDSLLRTIAVCLDTDPSKRYQSVEELQIRLMAAAPGTDQSAQTAPFPRVGTATAVTGNSIAVLPFVDLSPERDQEYFCDGIADELISSLTQINDLHVAARASSFCFKGKSTDIREIGSRLNVGAVLDGSVRKSGNRLRITAQLTSVHDGFQLWSEHYDRELADIFAIQDEVTQAIIEHLKLNLLPHEQQAVFKRATEDVEAHSRYLRGLHYLWVYSSTGFNDAITCFEQAISKDPEYAPAYWGLADAYLQMAFWGTTPPSAACQKVKKYARKALEIDPALGNAHGALSYAYTIHDWNWPAADREAKEALRLSPRSAMAHAYYSWLLLNKGNFQEGVAAAKEALRLDPDNSFIVFAGGLGFCFAGQFQRAIETWRTGISANPGFYILHAFVAEGLLCDGQYDEALSALKRAVELSNGSPYIVGRLGAVYHVCGDVSAADKIFRELEERAMREHVPPVSFLQMSLLRGNLKESMHWLDKAGETHDSYLSWMRVWPWQGMRCPGESELKARAKGKFVKFLIGRTLRRHRILEA